MAAISLSLLYDIFFSIPAAAVAHFFVQSVKTFFFLFSLVHSCCPVIKEDATTKSCSSGFLDESNSTPARKRTAGSVLRGRLLK
jgi:hypothetical protein